MGGRKRGQRQLGKTPKARGARSRGEDEEGIAARPQWPSGNGEEIHNPASGRIRKRKPPGGDGGSKEIGRGKACEERKLGGKTTERAGCLLRANKRCSITPGQTKLI